MGSPTTSSASVDEEARARLLGFIDGDMWILGSSDDMVSCRRVCGFRAPEEGFRVRGTDSTVSLDFRHPGSKYRRGSSAVIVHAGCFDHFSALFRTSTWHCHLPAFALLLLLFLLPVVVR